MNRQLPHPTRFNSQYFWRLLALFILLPIVNNNCSAAIITGPFGANGEGGTDNGQVFSFGTGGSVFELDTFVRVGGQDLNGAQIGTAAQRSIDSLPSGVSVNQSSSLSADLSDLTLNYTISNQSGANLADFGFFLYIDPEIDVAANTYFNEFATVAGALGTGSGDNLPDSFEVDEPGFVFGDIFDNLRLGSLDNSNSITSAFPDDVAMALGFELGDLADQRSAMISIMLSDDGDSLNSFSIQHADSGAASFDSLTLSGASSTAVPEPSSMLLLSVVITVGSIRRSRRSRD